MAGNEITLPSEVTHVVRTAQGTIHLYSKGYWMTIPQQTGQYDELAMHLLAKFPSIGTDTLTFYYKYFFIIAFVDITLFMSLLIFDNKILLFVIALVFMSLFLIELRKRYLAYKVIKSKGLLNILVFGLIVAGIVLYVLIPKLIK